MGLLVLSLQRIRKSFTTDSSTLGGLAPSGCLLSERALEAVAPIGLFVEVYINAHASHLTARRRIEEGGLHERFSTACD